jgi:tetratricopeptide (TPR) repeat protein
VVKCGFAAAALAIAGAQLWAQAQSVNQRRATALEMEQDGKNAEAESAWRSVLRVHPGDTEAYAHLGLLEARQEHYGAAVPLYRKALALNPEMPSVRLDLGLALFKSGAMKDAIETFSLLVKEQPPSSPEALRLEMLIGMAHYGLGEYAAAAPHLRKATANDSQNAQGLAYLADAEIHLGKQDEALPLAEKAIQINPGIVKARVDLGILYADRGRREDAVKEFKAAIQLSPNDPNPHRRLARLYQAMGKKEEAKAEFAKTKTLHEAKQGSVLTELEAAQDQGTPAAGPSLPPLEK